MNDTSPHDMSGGAASANTVRGRSGSTVGPSGSHYNIGPPQKSSGPIKQEKSAMSHSWDTHHRRAMIGYSRKATRSIFVGLSISERGGDMGKAVVLWNGLFWSVTGPLGDLWPR